MTKPVLAALALGAVLLGGVAHAAPPPRTRGTIEAVSGDTLDLMTRAGQKVEMRMTADTKVLSVTKAGIGDIKPDSYVGVTAAPQADGTLKAMEVHVFAPSLRGVGDGHYPWDIGGPTSTMTNGAVGAVAGTSGRTITVQYKGGEKEILVPEDVPIVAVAPGDKALVKPGAKVIALATKGADGALTANAVMVGEDGTAPPM